MSRRRILGVTLLAVAGIAATSAVETPTKLIWNVTPSAPIGFYTIEQADRIEAPELVAVRPPEPLAGFTVDGVEMGDALDHDRIGRALPVWQGCRVIADGQLFLMNWDVPDSLDGRYFGPIPASSVIGRALPLWTDEEGDGRFVLRTPTH